MKKIDAHAHLIGNICGTGSEGELRPLGNGMVEYATGRKFRLIPEGYGDKELTPETLISVMDENDVAYAVCLQGNYAGFQNLYTYEAQEKYRGRILAAGTYDPFFRNKDKVIHHLFDELGIRVIKMEVSNGSGLMANHPTVDLNGDVMNEVYRMAESHHLIFYIDIGRPGNNCYQVKALSEAIRKYPEMTFIVCHLTAPQPGTWDVFTENMRLLKLPNVYFDIAALPVNTKDSYPFPLAQKHIRYAMDELGSDRILWGTDFPAAMVHYSYRDSYRYIEESELFTEEEKEKILCKNAEALFGDLL